MIRKKNKNTNATEKGIALIWLREFVSTYVVDSGKNKCSERNFYQIKTK